MSKNAEIIRLVGNIFLSLLLFVVVIFCGHFAEDILVVLVIYIGVLVIFNSYCTFVEKQSKE